MADLLPLSVDEFRENFLDVQTAESAVAINRNDGSVTRATAQAASVNDFFIQQQNQKAKLASRLQTATGVDVDSFVDQFSPFFDGRIQAGKANSFPVPPTNLVADSIVFYLACASVANLQIGQTLQLTKFTKVATTKIAAIEPTRTLTAVANPNDVVIFVDDTTGMFPGSTLFLVDGIYSVKTVVTSIVSGTQATVTAIRPTFSHTFSIGTTIHLLDVLRVDALTFVGGAVQADFTAGTIVTPLDLLEGLQFFRLTPDASAPTIALGVIVQTQLDGIQYVVVADANNPHYNPFTQLYTLPANAKYVHVGIEASVAGTASNVIANTLTNVPVLPSGIDGAQNLYAIQNGTDQETDDAVKTRFQDFLVGRDSGTDAAITSKIEGVQTGIIFATLENTAADGVTVQLGHFVVVASDSTGVLGTALFDAIYAAVDKARPLTSTFSIIPPNVVQPTIAMTVTVLNDPAVDVPGTIAIVQENIFNNSLGAKAGAPLVFQKLIQIAMDTPNVINVTKLLVNGNGFHVIAGVYTIIGTGPADIAATPLQLIRPPLTNITVD